MVSIPIPPAYDATRHIVFVHGVEWEFNADLAGYSLPLQRGIRSQAPSMEIRFYEVLWSDLVERDERMLMAGAGLLGDLLSGNLVDAVVRLFNLIAKEMRLPAVGAHELIERPLPNLVSQHGGLIENALSAILDVVFYFRPEYGRQICATVEEVLQKIPRDASNEIVVFGHSLGSVILFDVIGNAIARSGKSPVDAFVTAGSPLGLFYPTAATKGFPKRWQNICSSNDFVATWNPLKDYYGAAVQDLPILTDGIPVLSHIKYWGDATVATSVAMI
jgi:hypothetical protein